ncbi:hypothetical protein CEG14_15545 [Bordetella genomosp. 1]|uniref:Phage protein Gp138 N-terminal domain-containing protein n=1 Tax=Bordetella genomosp. 1 TaxID=1395607 RepID=A0A261SH84_9BORD|nr:Gp138 family membrane-puncturing spike protein [Bordetella genomosp. 1]MDQ8034972.1 Gp138 family membrane-puncturing spike protein [Bordetella sp.]OZI36411.1 hypothetical protein CEG14_15545 [Bordetella genomosp. 1]OZI57868.1 hypothetical protein CAL27_20935 [Bordetella genomosp. 1]
MNRYERINDPEGTQRQALRAHQAGMWTAMPGIVQAFDAAAQTVSVQLAVLIPVREPDGSSVPTQIDVLHDCPVHFPAGGNCTLTFPVTPGDECLVVFGSRCIDGWWQSGGVQAQPDRRMHDLSDGFALVGFRSQPRALGGVSTSAVQLRSDDGQAFFELDPASHKLRIVAPGGLEVDAPESTFSGKVTVSGLFTFLGGLVGSALSGAAAKIAGAFELSGQLSVNGKRVDDTHTHTAQGSNAVTTPPN